MSTGPAVPAFREFASFPRRGLTIVRGEGSTLWDSEGRSYLDIGASHGVANLGHANPAVAEAVAAQVRELLHVGPGFDTPARLEFVARLRSIAPAGLDRVFLSNSGAEAVEAALKFARSSTGRPNVVAAMRGFHGRTMGALSATHRPELRAPFEPLVPGFRHVPFNDVPALEAAVDRSTAAVLLEPVQGEGGVHVASPEYLPAARAACDRAGALLILDEVQTGMGRTGRIFAGERWGVVPDLMAAAKSLAGGVPVGATFATAAVEERFAGSHTSTFGGNPVACAAGRAAVDFLLAHRLWERAERLGEAGRERLREDPAPVVREVRGLGLMIGIELRQRAAPFLDGLARAGFLAVGGGTHVLRLLPPLVITDAEWDRALGAVRAVLADG